MLRIVPGWTPKCSAASRVVKLKAEIEGRVSEVVKPRGAVVEAGDEIVKLSVDERPARLREARALMAQRQMELEAARKLNQQGHRADTQLAQSQALYETARAAAMRMELDLERTTIRASSSRLRPATVSPSRSSMAAAAPLKEPRPPVSASATTST